MTSTEDMDIVGSRERREKKRGPLDLAYVTAMQYLLSVVADEPIGAGGNPTASGAGRG